MQEQISARIPLWCIESETNFSADSGRAGTAAHFFGAQPSLPRMSKEMSHWIGDIFRLVVTPRPVALPDLSFLAFAEEIHFGNRTRGSLPRD
jgi:hypothetical protein